MSSFALLKRRVARALVREDIDAEEMAAWVSSATSRLNEELRLNDQLVRATLPLTSRTVVVPPDFIAVKSLRLAGLEFGSVAGPMIYAAPEALASMAHAEGYGGPGYYTTYGRVLEIAPFTADGRKSLDLWYYGSIRDLVDDADTNFVLEKYPDLYLNAVCAFGHRFYLENDFAQAKEGYVALEIARLMERKDAEKYGDGPLIARPTRKMGGRHS